MYTRTWVHTCSRVVYTVKSWDWVRGLGPTTGLAGKRRSQGKSLRGKSQRQEPSWAKCLEQEAEEDEERECEMKWAGSGRQSFYSGCGGRGQDLERTFLRWAGGQGLLLYPPEDSWRPFDSDGNGPVGQEAWANGRRKERPHGVRAGSRPPGQEGPGLGLPDKPSPRVSPGQGSP